MSGKKLTTGKAYDVDSLVCVGWTNGESTYGVSFHEYFDTDLSYMGADDDGIEPLFAPESVTCLGENAFRPSRLSTAIETSISHNEIARVTVQGLDSSEVLAELNAIYDGEIDHTMVDGVMDVWGYQADSPEGQMEWRLAVAFE